MTNNSLIEKLQRVEIHNCMLLATEVYAIVREHVEEQGENMDEDGYRMVVENGAVMGVEPRKAGEYFVRYIENKEQGDVVERVIDAIDKVVNDPSLAVSRDFMRHWHAFSGDIAKAAIAAMGDASARKDEAPIQNPVYHPNHGAWLLFKEGWNARTPKRESSAWQPIITAPKHKLLILFAWHSEGNNWKMAVGSKGSDDVWDWDNRRLDREWHLKPTHWQYLPKEPPYYAGIEDREGGK